MPGETKKLAAGMEHVPASDSMTNRQTQFAVGMMLPSTRTFEESHVLEADAKPYDQPLSGSGLRDPLGSSIDGGNGNIPSRTSDLKHGRDNIIAVPAG